MEWNDARRKHCMSFFEKGLRDREVALLMADHYNEPCSEHSIRSIRGRLERSGALQRGVAGSSRKVIAEMKKELVIMRGLPGSGKTRRAHFLAKSAIEEGRDVVVCSADDFFETREGYVFDPKKLGQAHAYCFNKAAKAMMRGIPLVIVDNTNTQVWEFYNYQLLGEHLGYDVQVFTEGGRSHADVRLYARRNIHGVPEIKILEMAYRWEDSQP